MLIEKILLQKELILLITIKMQQLIQADIR